MAGRPQGEQTGKGPAPPVWRVTKLQASADAPLHQLTLPLAGPAPDCNRVTHSTLAVRVSCFAVLCLTQVSRLLKGTSRRDRLSCSSILQAGGGGHVATVACCQLPVASSASSVALATPELARICVCMAVARALPSTHLLSGRPAGPQHSHGPLQVVQRLLYQTVLEVDCKPCPAAPAQVLVRKVDSCPLFTCAVRRSLCHALRSAAEHSMALGSCWQQAGTRQQATKRS